MSRSDAAQALAADLEAEQAALDAVVADRDDTELLTMTPAEGWDVRDQLAHLAGFDENATTALRDPEGFTAVVERILQTGEDPIDAITERARGMEPSEVVAWWRDARAELLDAIREADPSARVPWYGPPMSHMSFVTARLMETWAHGQDVRDAYGLPPEVSDRLRHVAHIGIGARTYSYVVRGLDVPPEPVAVRLVAPDGSEWTWGDPDAADVVSGSALDFCLVVTQRRHLDDVDLRIEGPFAKEWMGIAQAFAGGPGPGRPPLQR